jgi:hypothetical protein
MPTNRPGNSPDRADQNPEILASPSGALVPCNRAFDMLHRSGDEQALFG